MLKYHLNIAINKIYNHAGTKANVDCKRILLRHGYQDKEISFVKSPWLLPLNLLKLFFKLSNSYFNIVPKSILITQYPLLGINKYFAFYAKILKKKKCLVGCIIHDIDALRYNEDETAVALEIKALAAYDFIISHNPSMTQWLKSKKITSKIFDLTLFDYLSDFVPSTDKIIDRSNTIIFAGHLGRCSFLEKLHNIPNINFNLYGPGLPEKLKEKAHINWHGSFSNDEIIYKIRGGFGLIWDGPEVDKCTGIMGAYLKINTPHKLSLYLSAGIPVIMPANAALSKFVNENKLGICVNSLYDISTKISKLSHEEYLEMRKNVLTIGERLRNGNFLENVLNQVDQTFSADEAPN